MEQLQRDSEAKQMELIQVQQELEEARQQEKQRYEDMKLRIQYMYENSSTDIWKYYFLLIISGIFKQCPEYGRDYPV